MSPTRPILPGLKYHMPPSPPRQPLVGWTEGELAAFVDQLPLEDPAKELGSLFDVVSPLVGRELAYRSHGSRPALVQQLSGLAQRIEQGNYQPTLVVQQDAYLDFTFMPMEHFGPQAEMRVMPSFSQLIQLFLQRENGGRIQKNCHCILSQADEHGGKPAHQKTGQSTKRPAPRPKEGRTQAAGRSDHGQYPRHPAWCRASSGHRLFFTRPRTDHIGAGSGSDRTAECTALIQRNIPA